MQIAAAAHTDMKAPPAAVPGSASQRLFDEGDAGLAALLHSLAISVALNAPNKYPHCGKGARKVCWLLPLYVAAFLFTFSSHCM